MFGRSLLLLGCDESTITRPLISQVLDHWPEDDRPDVLKFTFEQVANDASLLKRCGAAWLLLEGERGDHFYEVVAQLQDRHLPAMISRPHETWPIGSTLQDGIIVAPPEMPPLALYAMLRTLWAQTDMLQALQTEIAILTAHQGGLCDQIGKMDEELRLASQLQREFLPQNMPKVPQIDSRVFFRPAGYVSGDIYDILRLDERHIGIFLADAVGHGVPAALLTVYIQRSLFTKEVGRQFDTGYRIISPDETMARLNACLVEHQTGKVRTATAVYGVLNLETLELQLARAGHPFPMLLRGDGTIEELSPDGSILGVFPDERFELMKVQLRPDDRLLIFSDGFEVAFREVGSTTRVADPQYTRKLAELAGGSIDEAMRRLSKRLDRAAGSLNQADDLTAVLIGVINREAAGDTDAALPFDDAVAAKQSV